MMTPVRVWSVIRGAVFGGTLTLISSASIAAQRGGRGVAPPRGDSGIYGALSHRYIGPPGNRVDAVVGIAGDASTYYVGAASGGIWKTTDGGVHWSPIFDKEMVSSIGALAVAPSNPRIVWAGTGESFIRSHISMGWGMFRSTDAARRGAGSAQRIRVASRASPSTRAIPTSRSSPHSATRTVRSKSEASSAP